MDLLPEDVLADVLARLAPRALAVSRSVCREWRAVADADARCQHQLRHADLLPVTLGGVFVRPSMAHRIAGDLQYYLGMVFHSYYIPYVVDCCNGLLLLDNVDQVVNPATKQWARLPPYPALPEQGTNRDDYHYKFLAFDPTLSPHYEVLAMREPPDPSEAREWPPSVYVRIYSSSTGRWEERPFVREEGQGPRTIANVRRSGLDHGHYHAAYWHGALYVYWTDCITRITSSEDKYQVINLPNDINASKYYHLRLGKSKNGVHFAVVDDQNRLQVWFLDETGGSTEWVLKHSANLQATKLILPKGTDRPWILQNGNYDQGRSNREPIPEEKSDWQSDDDNAVVVEELDKEYSWLYVEVFGFHPYKEIIFLFLHCRVVAYYFNTSKVQELGELRIKHRYQNIDEAFMYTPCWVGELSENN